MQPSFYRDAANRPMAEDETNLDAALLKICKLTRHGTVEGVVFDLRHERLDPKEWLMEPIGIAGFSRPFRCEGQPFLWFPWYGPFGDTDVERTIEGEIEFLKEKDANYPVPSVDSLRHTYTPDAIIEAGDKIEIDRVDIEGEITGLHHEHDVQRRLAYIKIVNSSGSTYSLKKPIVFTGASATWTGGYAKILQKINRRLCARFKIESLHDPRVNAIAKRGALADAEAAQSHRIDRSLKRDPADAETALLHAAILDRTDLDALLRRYARRTADRKDRMLVKATIKYMMDEACLVGYRLGRAEADLRMKPLAEGGLRSGTAAPKGGRESGASRRKKAETWQSRALTWAQEERIGNPTGSQEDIVGAMKDRATKDDWLPSEGWLLKFLRKEASGVLPAKQKKTRRAPKRGSEGPSLPRRG
jgi:hypothetical protein